VLKYFDRALYRPLVSYIKSRVELKIGDRNYMIKFYDLKESNVLFVEVWENLRDLWWEIVKWRMIRGSGYKLLSNDMPLDVKNIVENHDKY